MTRGMSMLYFRRIWLKLILALLGIIVVAQIILKPLSKLFVITFNELTKVTVTDFGFLLSWSNKLAIFSEKVADLAVGCLITVILVLIIWLLIDLFTRQLKLDYYSIQLGKHLQKARVNNFKVAESEQEKANFWLRRLRIIRWKHKYYVLIPCGPRAAVQDIIKGRCDGYCIGWLNLTIKDSDWANGILVHDTLHFNWLILKGK